MIPIKSPEEIAAMAEGGKKLRFVLEKTLQSIRPGISTLALDKIAEEEILRLGGKPSFKMVPGYEWTTCITVNHEVVHGIPKKEKIIKKGDSVGVDVGIYYRDFHTDTSWSIKVGEKDNRFLETGKKALAVAIKQITPGNYIGDISLAIQTEVEREGYSPVKALTGHGVGQELHEEPLIPCFFKKDFDKRKTPLLKEGMVLAVEVIYTLGSPDLVLDNDGWTIETEDGKIAGLFEKTVAVTADGHLVLT